MKGDRIMDLRVGVVGTGTIGNDHIRRINEDLSGAKVVAVTDIILEAAQKTADKFNVRVEKSDDDLINAPDIDAVVITSIGSAHEQTIQKAIAAGKYIFCEKPLSDTAEACKRIIAAEMKHGKRLLQLGFMRRFDKAYNMLKDKLETGDFGKALTVHCKHRNPFIPSYMDTHAAIYEGLIHEMDILHWLVNDEYVSAQIILPKSSKFSPANLRDPIVMILRTKEGLYLEVELFINSQFGYQIKTEVLCEEGVLSQPQPMVVETIKGGVLATDVDMVWTTRFVEAYDIEIQAWIDSVKAGAATGPSAWDGYVAAVTSDACIKSLETGAIEPVIFDDMPDFYKV